MMGGMMGGMPTGEGTGSSSADQPGVQTMFGTSASPATSSATPTQGLQTMYGSGGSEVGGTGSTGSAPPKQNMMPGDWICEKCGDHQFARNITCRKSALRALPALAPCLA